MFVFLNVLTKKKTQLVDFSCWLGIQENIYGSGISQELSEGVGFWYFTQVWGEELQ